MDCNHKYSSTPLYGRLIHPNIQRIIAGNTSTSTGWGCTIDIEATDDQFKHSYGLCIFYSTTVKGLHVSVNKKLSDN